jgi:hypothetical protein
MIIIICLLFDFYSQECKDYSKNKEADPGTNSGTRASSARLTTCRLSYDGANSAFFPVLTSVIEEEVRDNHSINKLFWFPTSNSDNQ